MPVYQYASQATRTKHGVLAHMKIRLFTFSLLFAFQATPRLANADILEITGAIESGRIIDGVNLTKNQLSTAVGVEWSANNGGFAKLECFLAENEGRIAIQRGCDASLGWFKPLNDYHALTFNVSRHDYSSPKLKGWEYTDASVSWHLGKTVMLRLKGSDSLLGQGSSSVTTSLHFNQPLNERWGVKFEAGAISLESSATQDRLAYGLISTQYSKGRWAAKLNLMLSSSAYNRFSKLEVGQPEVGVSVRYRLY